MDTDLQKKLDEINQNLAAIKKNSTPNVFRSFFTGTFTGLGSVIGVAIAFLILGWILNVMGIIPAFRDEVNSWHKTLDNLQQYR